MSDVIRIGNCSGFYGDRFTAMREMLEGGPLDVLTGDYLAELTMLILGRDVMRDPSLGYARTFVRQLEDCLGLALERGVRIVSNAGGLNPAGLADRVREVATGLGLSPSVAYVDGDDLLPRAEQLGLGGKPLTANAYVGGFGIATALSAGADVVVTGRVTDASLVVGPAAARFGWTPQDLDALAGAVVAGHVIECGAQATGGNLSGFVPDERPLGFPVAEVASDGSSVITKHDGTGGTVSVDTVTAQLVYEIAGPAYLGPDVTAHLDTVALAQVGPDRVAISGVRGSAPPATLKVCVNELGGFRNTAELVITGLDVEAKAAWVRRQLEQALARKPPAHVDWHLARTDHEDADTEEAASARLRVTVRDADPDPVGRAFTAPLVELALASYPGFTTTGPPGPAAPYGVYRAVHVGREEVSERVVLDGHALPLGERPTAPTEGGGDTRSLRSPAMPGPQPRPLRPAPPAAPLVESAPPPPPAPDKASEALGEGFEGSGGGRRTVRVPFGRVVHARSGDKGGDANVGVWPVDAAARPDRVAWLAGFLDVERVKELLPEAAPLEVEVFALPNLGAVNVVVHGLLGDGVAASSRFDPQAKGLGEWLRSRHVDVPEELL